MAEQLLGARCCTSSWNDVVAAAEQRVGCAAWISAMAARVLAPRLSSGVFRVAAQMEAMYARTSLEQ